MIADKKIYPFGAAFDKATEAQWRTLAEKALRGAPLASLNSVSADGIDIAPLHSASDNRNDEAARPVRKTGGDWTAFTRIDDPNPETANALAWASLVGGAQGLHLVFAGASGSFGLGLRNNPATAAAQVLDGIDPAQCALTLDLPLTDAPIARDVSQFVRNSGLNPSNAKISFGLDPLFSQLLKGASADAFPKQLDAAVALSNQLAEDGFSGPFVCADARPIHAAGASEAQELAFLLAAAVTYLRGFEEKGISPDRARGYLSYRLAADADQFLTIAKLRALRRLLSRVEDACGLTPEPVSIHAETAWRMMTRVDPWVNVLRSTVAVFSAVTGGADHVSVLPHTRAKGLPDAEAQRLTRNLQLVLQEESHLGAVDDPAGGSGGIEALTDALCKESWSLFQSIEKQGGIVATLTNGSFAGEIAAIRDKRALSTASAQAPITGTSSFPNLEEKSPTVSFPIPEDWASAYQEEFQPVRLSEPFEALRDTAAKQAANGNQPSVFLANIGPLAAHNARTNFAANFLAAGGIKTSSGGSSLSEDQIVAEFVESSAPLACLCASDDLYASEAVPLIRALKKTGAKKIVLAGRARDNDKDFRAAGLDGYIYQGVNMTEVLAEMLKHFD